MLVNGVLIPAHDPGSLNRYANSLSIHMRSIILGLELMGVKEIIIWNHRALVWFGGLF
jgi:hypothetical protein